MSRPGETHLRQSRASLRARSKQGQGCWFLLFFFLSVFRKPSPDPVSYVVSYKALKQANGRAEPNHSGLSEPRAEQPPSIQKPRASLLVPSIVPVLLERFILKKKKTRKTGESHRKVTRDPCSPPHLPPARRGGPLLRVWRLSSGALPPLL